MPRALLLAVVAIALVAPARAAAAPPPPVIVDTDMDFDDAAALAYLSEADRLGLIDLRAVTVSITGVAYPGAGLGQLRCLLTKVGTTDVPTTDGDVARVNNFPPVIRLLLSAVVERAVRPAPDLPCADAPTEGEAAALIATTIRSSARPVTVITLGPVTNLAQALERDPGLTDNIERVMVMGGDTTDRPPEHPDDAHDYNLWVDAPAAQAVVTALRTRVWMTSRNATGHVPLSAAFRLRLSGDRTTAAAHVVYAIASDPLIMTGEQAGAYWWDPLTVVAATVGGIERFELTHIHVQQSGAEEGRTVVNPDGSAVHFGVSADADRFHRTFLEVLNHRPVH